MPRAKRGFKARRRRNHRQPAPVSTVRTGTDQADHRQDGKSRERERNLVPTPRHIEKLSLHPVPGSHHEQDEYRGACHEPEPG